MSIEKSVEYLQEYWNAYDKQPGFKNYTHNTFLEDALYGIGVSIDERYEFAGGFDEFKKFLINYLRREEEARKEQKSKLRDKIKREEEEEGERA